jgi:hypothetical protein
MSEELKQAGSELANIAFNLAQKGGQVLAQREADLLKAAQRKWDAALSQPTAASEDVSGFDVQAHVATGGGLEFPLITVRDTSTQLGQDVFPDESPVVYAFLKAWLSTTTPSCLEQSSAWFALVMGAAASIEDASHCLRDPEAKRAADGAAKHYRDAANALWSTKASQEQASQPAPTALNGGKPAGA